MKSLPQSLIIQKNLIASTYPWLILLDIKLTDTTTYYLVNNNEDIIFGGRTYTKFRFKIKFGEESSTGEIPTWKLYICNVMRIFQADIEEHKGGVDSSVTIRLVNTADLSADYSSLTVELSVQRTDIDGFEWIVFTLGAPNPMIMEFLMFLYSSNSCNWVYYYKGPECKYTGVLPSCSGTIEDCRLHQNSKRFGGHIGLNESNFRIA